MCFMNPGSDIANGRASSLVAAPPAARRATIARRVGSASAANTVSSGLGL